MPYALLFLTCVILEYALIRFERRKGIGAEVTNRSSHTICTPNAGGIVLPVCILAFCIINLDALSNTLLTIIASILCLSLLSLVDDIHPLPSWPRLIAQLIVVGVVATLMLPSFNTLWFVVLLALGIITINSINFIDGICSMAAFYGIVVLITLIYTTYSLSNQGLSPAFYLCLAVLTGQISFTLFNVPDKIFFGDVGSITLGSTFFLVIGQIMITTGNIAYITFIAVALCDSALTTLIRLLQGHNIMKPHRRFLYQILDVQKNIPHKKLSATYAFIQLLINVIFICLPEFLQTPFMIFTFGMLIFTHIILRKTNSAAKLL